MESLSRLARRFGLNWSEVDRATVLERNQARVQLAGALETASLGDRHRTFCILLGTRLGIDALVAGGPSDGQERIQRVFPRSAVLLADAIARASTETRALAPASNLVVVSVAERGRSLVLAPTDHDAERALFYRAYKLRPAQNPEGSEPLATRVNTWQEPGGIASSLASLMPDYDLDSARTEALVLVPDYTQLVVIRQPVANSAARGYARKLLASAEMPMSCRLYRMNRDGIVAREVVGPHGDLDSSEIVSHLVSVTSTAPDAAQQGPPK